MSEIKTEAMPAFAALTAFPADAAVTMAYVPFQLSQKTYDAEEALVRGTLFPVLDKPFLRAAVR